MGSPRIMVNCAGIVGPSNTPILDYPAADYDRVYSVNLRGSFLMIKHTLPDMLKGRYGRILLMVSISGKEENPFMCGYTSCQSGCDWVGEKCGKGISDERRDD